MEEHIPAIVEWINHHLGAEPGHHIVPTQIVMATIVILAMFAIFGFLRTRLSVENPGKLQQAMEVAVEFLQDQLDENIGHEGRKYLSMIGTIGLFILFCNLAGLIPGLVAPTSNINVPAGCAITVFLYYNYQGMRKQGLFQYL
jgi:F-type H+-transporting ATPase subunit a